MGRGEGEALECPEGHHQRFGLVHVDFETQKRTPTAS
ncbi:hypothetical protein [Kitasatospora sp. NPDC058190]